MSRRQSVDSLTALYSRKLEGDGPQVEFLARVEKNALQVTANQIRTYGNYDAVAHSEVSLSVKRGLRISKN
jgi:hypothetical protein